MIFLSILTLLLITLGWVYQVAFVRPSDYVKIKELKQEREIASSKNSFSTTSQKRKGVRKEIWFSEENALRLHYRIESESSLLTFLPQDHKIDVIENLEMIKFWMQDKLYPNPVPMQQMRFLEADQGTYRFTSQEFAAETVTVSIFRLPGYELPDQLDLRTAFLRGVAENILFSISGKMPQFEAKNFKASLAKPL